MAQAVPAEQKWWSGGRSPFNVEYGKLMMWYFLMSDAFTFGAFLISYGTVRFSANSWPDPNFVFRSFPIGGQRRFEFRLETFNLFNWVNFDFPAMNVGNQNTFGRITNSLRNPREMQMAVKFYF